MKKHRLLIVSLLFVFMAESFSLSALAETIDRSYIFNVDEYQNEIYPAADRDPYLSYEEVLLTDSDAANAYMLHWVRSADFRDALLAGKSVFELISKEYFWTCPKGNGKELFINDNGQWRLSGVITFTTGISDVIDNALVEQQIEEYTSREGKLVRPVVYFCAGRYATNFAFFETESSSYFIPYSPRPDYTGLENGKVYSGTEMIRILEENYPLPDITNTDPSIMGGYAYSQEMEIKEFLYMSEETARGTIWPYIAVTCGILFFAIYLLIYLRKRQKGSNFR